MNEIIIITFSVKDGGGLLGRLVGGGIKYTGWFWFVNIFGPGGNDCIGVVWLGINCDVPGTIDVGGTFWGRRKLFALGGGPPTLGWVDGIGWQGGNPVFKGGGGKPVFIGGGIAVFTGGCWIIGGWDGADVGGGIVTGLGGRTGGAEPINGNCKGKK